MTCFFVFYYKISDLKGVHPSFEALTHRSLTMPHAARAYIIIAIIVAGSNTDFEASPVVDTGLKIPAKGDMKIPVTA